MVAVLGAKFFYLRSVADRETLSVRHLPPTLMAFRFHSISFHQTLGESKVLPGEMKNTLLSLLRTVIISDFS